ncbi:ScbA/BarX family gamma-butyrolactone biosynthesis protein [Streptomyces sp. NPDC032940]|uniref:ScbA/BarX family gamma-butyrolactone biosynthesis protein n=1 Tax=Streptomyces sp. NPDC032940 TaxID=3155366 RepID=UPI0033D7D480
MSASTFHVERAVSGSHDMWRGAMGPAHTTGLRYPSLTTTVPKEFVHRASVAEVMLTGWTRRDDTHFTVAAQWPRLHGFFATVDGYHDPLLVAETIRQAGLLVAHTEFGVPLGHQFLMWDLTVDVRPEQLRIETTPAAPEIEIACSDIKRRGSSISGLHLTVVIRRDGQVAATGAATFNCTSASVYRRLRAAQIGDGVPAPLPLTSPIAPQDVGRISPTDVVLSPAPEPDCWQLRVDTRHPVLFDHPVDHVPGMVLMEAARQAAAAFLGRACLPVGMTSAFTRYAELDAPCMVKVCALVPDAEGGERLLVTGHQDGNVVFSSVVTVAPETA